MKDMRQFLFAHSPRHSSMPASQRWTLNIYIRYKYISRSQFYLLFTLTTTVVASYYWIQFSRECVELAYTAHYMIGCIVSQQIFLMFLIRRRSNCIVCHMLSGYIFQRLKKIRAKVSNFLFFIFFENALLICDGIFYIVLYKNKKR